MQDPKTAALEAWDAFASRDPDRIRSVLTEDATWIAPPGNATQVALGLPSGYLETRAGIVDFLTNQFRRLFPAGADIDFTNTISAGYVVIFEQRLRAVTAQGRDYDNRYCWIFEMDGARVRRIREYMDTHSGYLMIFADDPVGPLAG